MKLKDQVCSLKLAKKLKELGVKQESLWWWEEDPLDGTGQSRIYHKKNCFPEAIYTSAFTVAELGEMLPLKIKSYRYYKNWEWRCVDEDKKRSANTQIDTKSEANVRAKILIYLIENKLVEIK